MITTIALFVDGIAAGANFGSLIITHKIGFEFLSQIRLFHEWAAKTHGQLGMASLLVHVLAFFITWNYAQLFPALLALSVFFYTGMVMMPVNRQLLALTQEDFDKQPDHVRKLWESWGFRHIFRVAITCAVFVSSFYSI